MKTKFTAVILAGGLSSRMQKNKALCTLGNKRIIEYSIEFFENLGYSILISGNKAEYKFLAYPVVEDNFINLGPLSGLEAALNIVETEKIILWSVDTPFVDKKLILQMEKAALNYEIVVPKIDGYIQPLNAYYSKLLHPRIKVLLENNQPYLKDLIRAARTKIIPSESKFYNINTPEELLEAEKLLVAKGIRHIIKSNKKD